MNPPDMYHQAVWCFEAALRLQKEDFVSDGDRATLPVPGLVMAAHAAEIAMKGLISLNVQAPSSSNAWKAIKAAKPSAKNGHDLEGMFLALTLEQRSSIQAAWDSVPHEEQFILVSRNPNAHHADQVSKGPPNETYFELNLRLAATSFEDWRYTYEKDLLMVNSSFVECLAKCAIEMLREALKPLPAQTPSAPSPASARP